MQQDLKQITSSISVDILKAYVSEQTEKILQFQHQIEKQYQHHQENDLHLEMIEHSKAVANNINLLVSSLRSFLKDIGLQQLHDFYEHCNSIMAQNTKKLSKMFMNLYNRLFNISNNYHPIIIKKLKVVQCAVQDKKDKEGTQDNNLSMRAFEGIDYYLNLLIHEETKSYNEYKSQCEKLLMQREIVQNIRPSQASRYIQEASNMIQDIIVDSDNLFKDIYLIKQLDIKASANNIEKPENLQEIFKEQLDKSLKEKFKNGINEIIEKYKVYADELKKKKQRNYSIQTEQTQKYKCQQKLQLSLICQKKNNERLRLQLQKAKNQSQKAAQKFEKLALNNNNLTKLQKKQSLKSFFRGNEINDKYNQTMKKYTILEGLYNQKCEQLQKLKDNREQKRQIIKYVVPAGKKCSSEAVQTDHQFYYFYQNFKIKEQEEKLIELQKIIHHKDYMIQELQAIRTFRDNFKSKKEMFSTYIKAKDKLKMGNTLHYLDDSDECMDQIFQNQQNASIQNTNQALQTKKKVTMNIVSDQITSNRSFLKRKKQKKTTQTNENKLYFALNDKVNTQQQEMPSEKYLDNQYIGVSIRSILKQKTINIKKDIGMQTDGDQKPMASADNSRIMKNRNLRASEFSDKNKEISYFNSSYSLRKSQKLSKQFSKTGFSLRKNLLMIKESVNSDRQKQKDNLAENQGDFSINRNFSPAKKENIYQGKHIKQKMETLTQVLRVNNSLNLNFGQIVEIPKKGSKQPLKTKIQPFAKMKKMRKV